MTRRMVLSAAFALVFCGVSLPRAYAQVAHEMTISRPTESGGSARLGWTGGAYTRQSASVLDMAPDYSQSASGALQGGGLRRPNYFGAVGNFARLPAAPLPQAFMWGRSRVFTERRGVDAIASLGALSEGALYASSGLQAATSTSVPLMGLGSMTPLASQRQPYFAPQSQDTSFCELFGLQATPAPAEAETPDAHEGITALLARRTEQSIRRTEAEALAEFKLATREGDDRMEQLCKARWALRVVRDLDAGEYIPSLLLVHIALEQNEVLTAASRLADAVARHPKLFLEWPDLAAYFGDPGLLEKQMRAFVRIGDDRPSQAGYALQAYCAWVLGDRARVKEALDRMASTEQQSEEDARLVVVRYALEAAME